MDESNVDTRIETPASTSMPASTSQLPSAPSLIPPHLNRQGTGSTTGSLSFSQVPTGSWDTILHGSCPRCHHWHNKVTLRISRNPGVFNGVRCEKCAHRWFGIGGNSTHTSLASQESINPNENDSVVRGLLLQTMRNMSAVGSPTLAAVQEDPLSGASPLSRHPSSRHPPGPSRVSSAHGAIGTASTTTTPVPVPQEEGITTPDSHPHATPSAHQTQTNPNDNNSTQSPKKTNRHSFTKRMRRQISDSFTKWRNRLRPGRLRKARDPPAVPKQETRPTNHRQSGTVEVQQPELAPHSTGQPEDDPPEGTPPATVPNRTDEEIPELHSRTITNFRNALDGLPHRERIALLRRTLTEHQSCTCNNTCSCRQHMRPSSSVIPENSLYRASLYPYNQTEEFEPHFDDLLFIGAHLENQLRPFNGAGSQNQPLDRYSIGTSLSGATVVSRDSGRSITVTSMPRQHPRARSLPRAQPRRSHLRLQMDIGQEQQSAPRSSMEMQLTDGEGSIPQEIDGEHTLTQNDQSINRSEILNHDDVDRGMPSTHRMPNGVSGSISSDSETAPPQGRALTEDEPYMNDERNHA